MNKSNGESNGATPYLPPGAIKVIEYAEQCLAENRPFTIAECAKSTGLMPNSVTSYRALARQKGMFPEVENQRDAPADDAGTPVTDLLAAVQWTVRALRPFTEAERTAVLDLVREILT